MFTKVKRTLKIVTIERPEGFEKNNSCIFCCFEGEDKCPRLGDELVCLNERILDDLGLKDLPENTDVIWQKE
jgi:hypothetical protein